MTQAQLIKTIDGLMPEIVRTKQPDQVMLKHAREHNLAPAQLEKLGHVFNTSKTLVCMEKSANRGDSCSLVDVPAMVASYTTYSPDKELSKEDEKFHATVNKITKNAYANDGWEAVVAEVAMEKVASGDSLVEASELPDLRDIVEGYFNEKGGVHFQDISEGSEYIELAPRTPAYDIMHKSASADSGRQAPEQAEATRRRVREEMGQIAYETKHHLQEKCAALRVKFLDRADKWPEAVEDIWDTYGEKSASVLEFIDGYFKACKFSVPGVDLEKRAFVRPLVQDRHNVLELADEMIGVMEVHKKASAYIEKRAADPFSDFQKRYGTLRVSDLPTPYRAAISSNYKNDTVGTLPRAVLDRALDLFEDYTSDRERKKMDALLDDQVSLEDSFIPRNPRLADRLLAAKDVMKEELADAGNSLLAGLRNPFVDNFSVTDKLKGYANTAKSLTDYLKPKTDTRAKYLDQAQDAAKAQATLQQLILSDRVLREADPDEVTKIFEAMMAMSPTLAQDPMLAAPALKEAVQFGSLPIHLLKDYASLEKDLAGTAKDRAAVNYDKYHL